VDLHFVHTDERLWGRLSWSEAQELAGEIRRISGDRRGRGVGATIQELEALVRKRGGEARHRSISVRLPSGRLG
jgi:hypothetical protein